MLRLLSFIVILLLGSIHYSWAQNTVKITRQPMLWTITALKLDVSPKWTFLFKVHERFFTQPFNHFQMLARTGMYYKFGERWEGGLTFGFALNNPHSDGSPSSFVAPEFRIQAEFSHAQPIKKITLNHRFLIENRWMHKTSSEALVPGYNSYMRFRYRFGIDITLYKNKETGANHLRLRLMDEVLLRSQLPFIFEQNRAYIALHYQVLPFFAVEAGFQHVFQQKGSTAGDFFSREPFRLSLLFHAKTYKPKQE